MTLAEGATGVERDQTRQPAAREQAIERKEVVSGQIYITASDPIQAARDAADLVEETGGRIDNRTENPETDNSAASSSITARIPADKLTGTIDRIENLGKVTSISVTRDDVTMQYQDLDARIAALKASVDRLRGLIAGATNTADLIEAESALSSRQGELDSLTSQKSYLADQVDLSTITVQFSTDDVTPAPGPDTFWGGLLAGWHSLVAAVSDGVVALGRAVPWLGALAIGAAIVYAMMRLVRLRSTRVPPEKSENTDNSENSEDTTTSELDTSNESKPAGDATGEEN